MAGKIGNLKQNPRQSVIMEDESIRHKDVSKIKTKDIVCAGMFAALLAVLSQISIPLPSGVPVTIQTFAVALTGFVLAWKLGTAATLVYILMGAVGVPVFSGLSGGIQVLVNYTGGFIWGFIIMVLLCGIAAKQTNKFIIAMLSSIGLICCHVFGILQFMAVMHMSFVESFLLASAPYIIKDIISVVLAYIIGSQIRNRLLKADLL